MHINERLVEGVTILDLNGTLTLGAGDAVLKDKIHTLVHEGRRNFLLNLGSVPYVDSTGISEIIGAYTTAKRASGHLKLLNVPKRIHDLLVMTKLLTVFETFDGETEAVRSFSTPKA